jgi:hypothetical protein
VKRGAVLVLAVGLAAGCRKTPPADANPAPSSSAVVNAPKCAAPALRTTLEPGMVVDRYLSPVASSTGLGDRCVTIVRIDPTKFTVQLHTAQAEGGARTAPTWGKDAKLSAVLNASMYGEDGRSVGLLVARGANNNGGDNKKLGGFFAWDPVTPGTPPVFATGRDCAGFDLDDLRKRYRGVVQNYRLLDCEQKPIAWQDPKLFSAAVLGTDRKGNVVFAHARTPWSMTELARILAAPELELASAMHVEGGPEASLWVASPGGGAAVAEMGSFESGFLGSDENRDFWSIPNVIGVARNP